MNGVYSWIPHSKKIGFTQVQTDKCIYSISRSNNNVQEKLILGVYVNDILCLGSTITINSWFHQQLSNYFSITINLKISSFLGMQIDHDVPNKIITISQPGYINTILTRFNITKEVSKYPLQIPFLTYDLTDANPSFLNKQDQSIYMQIIGSLLFLIHTFKTRYIFPCQLSIPIYEIGYTSSIKAGQAYLVLYIPY